jgi:hypothetical protein
MNKSAQGRSRGARDSSNALGRRNIGGNKLGCQPSHPGRHLQWLLPAPDQQHSHPFSRKGQSDRTPDTATRTGYNRSAV